MRAADLLVPSACFVAGLALGAGFFASLWWSVRRTAGGTATVLLQFAAPVLRLAATVAGFYLVGAGDAVRLLSCLAGFAVARSVAIRRARAADRRADHEEAPHATRT